MKKIATIIMLIFVCLTLFAASNNSTQKTMLDGTFSNMPFYLSCTISNGKAEWSIKYAMLNTDNGSLKPVITEVSRWSSGLSSYSNTRSTVRGYIYDGYAKNSRGEFYIFDSDSSKVTEEDILDIYEFFKDTNSVTFTLDTNNSGSFTAGDGTYEPTYELPANQIKFITDFIENTWRLYK